MDRDHPLDHVKLERYLLCAQHEAFTLNARAHSDSGEKLALRNSFRCPIVYLYEEAIR
jgi:hypothetical protein